MDTIPFTLSDVFAGFGDGEGLLRNEGAHLALEYQVKDGIFGLLKGDLKVVLIPIDEVVSVTLTKGWFGTRWGVKIVIQCDGMDIVRDIPSASQGRLELCIAAKDVEAAEAFVYYLYDEANPSDSTPTRNNGSAAREQ
jgi:hypothetical protein